MHPNFLRLKPPEDPLDPRWDDRFEGYMQRVAPDFPNIPRAAFEEWLYSFWPRHISDLYGRIDFRALLFDVEEWSTAQCFDIEWYKLFNAVQSVEEHWTVEHFYEANRYRPEVQASWRGHGTWRVPPWVLKTATLRKRERHRDLRPLMLIEGHTRLGTLRLFKKNGLSADRHRVWVVRRK
jgi:hypothetical protein